MTHGTAKFPEAIITSATPTVFLRWVPKSMLQAMDMKLQQEWEIREYGSESRAVTKITTEWRDVPIVIG